MDLRSYTKQELALLYFPDSDPDVARAHLMRWIVRCTQLYEQLQKSGYTKSLSGTMSLGANLLSIFVPSYFLTVTKREKP